MARKYPVSSDMSGRVCLVTGANTGIGKVTALELARAGAHVVMACRSKDKAQAAMDEIREDVPNAELTFLALDLGSLASVRSSAARFVGLDLPLHVLINNAGLAGVRGETEDGFEITFGVNHLGHFLFTELLLHKLEASERPRVVIVASRAHARCKGIDFDALTKPTSTTTGFPEYEVSKLANVLHGNELARRLTARGSKICVYSLHPGVVASDIWRRVPWPFRSVMKWFMITNEEGALTTLHCASAAHVEGETGKYYDERKVVPCSKIASDETLAAELWTRSVNWVGLDEAEAAA